MEEDSTYEYLVDWLEIIQEKNYEQIRAVKQDNNLYIPYIGVPSPVVTTIFRIAEHFKLSNNAKYLAVHLFDKLMCQVFLEIIDKNFDNMTNFLKKSEFEKNLPSEVRLQLMSCIQIANKMASNMKELAVLDILNMLHKLEPHKKYTENCVLTSERKVLTTLNWKLSIEIPLNYVEVLIALTGLLRTPNIQEICNNLLDVAYLMHDKLYDNLQIIAKKNNCQSHPKIRMMAEANSMFLAAAVVLSSTFILGHDRASNKLIAKKLESITNIIVEEIWDFAKLLFKLAVH